MAVLDVKIELGTSRSLTNKLKKQLVKSSNTVSLRDLKIVSLNDEVVDLKRLILELKLDLSIAETAASEVETKLCYKIEVAAVEEQKDKILKLGRKLASNGYNLYLKKMANAYLKIDTEVLDHVEVSDTESNKFEDDEDSEDPVAPADP
ncbi:hypothetical protein F0562_013533 [Nyssa sinensis]|uniref:Uncharacterized protein n=1 Tax=Nyssa sinensis TaxID=561372 RepID=A0A5J4ZQ59_9ASTE|nr:hypothetical protein F0562_013533 [Nyssa sinensis]